LRVTFEKVFLLQNNFHNFLIKSKILSFAKLLNFKFALNKLSVHKLVNKKKLTTNEVTNLENAGNFKWKYIFFIFTNIWMQVIGMYVKDIFIRKQQLVKITFYAKKKIIHPWRRRDSNPRPSELTKSQFVTSLKCELLFVYKYGEHATC